MNSSSCFDYINIINLATAGRRGNVLMQMDILLDAWVTTLPIHAYASTPKRGSQQIWRPHSKTKQHGKRRERKSNELHFIIDVLSISLGYQSIGNCTRILWWIHPRVCHLHHGRYSLPFAISVGCYLQPHLQQPSLHMDSKKNLIFYLYDHHE